jgi:hypothetical protein
MRLRTVTTSLGCGTAARVGVPATVNSSNPMSNLAPKWLRLLASPISRQSPSRSRVDDDWLCGQFMAALLISQNGSGNLSAGGALGKLP